MVLVTGTKTSHSSEESSTAISDSSRFSAFKTDSSEAHSTSRSVVFVSSECFTQMVGKQRTSIALSDHWLALAILAKGFLILVACRQFLSSSKPLFLNFSCAIHNLSYKDFCVRVDGGDDAGGDGLR
jgi:hypothetical protein